MKPPIGVTPRDIFLDKRNTELIRAINEYSEYRKISIMSESEIKSHLTLMRTWAQELYNNCIEILSIISPCKKDVK